MEKDLVEAWENVFAGEFRAVHNFFHLGGAMSLAEVENMSTLGGSGGMLPQEILIISGVQVFWD